MNRRLAKTVIAAFRDEEEGTLRARLAQFQEGDWLRCMEWLHTSGLALYFFARIRALRMQDVMPARILHDLDCSYAENRLRTEDMFNEFVTINMELQRSRLSYANLAGFALAPRSCPDPANRYQHDLDFLVAQRDAEQCRRVLERQGYQLTSVIGNTWEFRAGPAEASSLGRLHKGKAQRSVELHLVPDDEQSESDRRSDKLSRLQLQVWNGFEFPALSECDKLLAQGLHLFQHFQTEWTRTAWMLEYATAIRSHWDDTPFWQETVAAIQAAPATRIGIGVASLIVSNAFGVMPPAPFLACTVDVMPDRVRLWAGRYADEVVFVECRGSKLYLLLQDVLSDGQRIWPSQRRRKLLPSHLAPHSFLTARSGDIRPPARTAVERLRFAWTRLRFHVTAGLRYKIEAMRWKKFIAGFQA